jgi:hypothetical protein
MRARCRLSDQVKPKDDASMSGMAEGGDPSGRFETVTFS